MSSSSGGRLRYTWEKLKDMRCPVQGCTGKVEESHVYKNIYHCLNCLFQISKGDLEEYRK